MARLVHFLGRAAGRHPAIDAQGGDEHYVGFAQTRKTIDGFADALADAWPGGVPLVREHDDDAIVGQVVSIWRMQDDSMGIQAVIDRSLPAGAALWEAVQSNQCQGLSIKGNNFFDCEFLADGTPVPVRNVKKTLKHIGVCVEPQYGDQGTYVKHFSEDEDGIMKTFVDQYLPSARYVSHGHRQRVDYWSQKNLGKFLPADPAQNTLEAMEVPAGERIRHVLVYQTAHSKEAAQNNPEPVFGMAALAPVEAPTDPDKMEVDTPAVPPAAAAAAAEQSSITTTTGHENLHAVSGKRKEPTPAPAPAAAPAQAEVPQEAAPAAKDDDGDVVMNELGPEAIEMLTNSKIAPQRYAALKILEEAEVSVEEVLEVKRAKLAKAAEEKKMAEEQRISNMKAWIQQHGKYLNEQEIKTVKDIFETGDERTMNLLQITAAANAHRDRLNQEERERELAEKRAQLQEEKRKLAYQQLRAFTPGASLAARAAAAAAASAAAPSTPVPAPRIADQRPTAPAAAAAAGQESKKSNVISQESTANFGRDMRHGHHTGYGSIVTDFLRNQSQRPVDDAFPIARATPADITNAESIQKKYMDPSRRLPAELPLNEFTACIVGELPENDPFLDIRRNLLTRESPVELINSGKPVDWSWAMGKHANPKRIEASDLVFHPNAKVVDGQGFKEISVILPSTRGPNAAVAMGAWKDVPVQ